MTSTTDELNLDAVGTWTDPVEFEVDADRIRRYAAATNDTLAPHAAGDLAPPVFAIVPAFEASMGVLVGGPRQVIPPSLVGAVLHGEQDFRYRRPIVPGMTLFTRAQVRGIQPRSSGVTVCVQAESRAAETGELVVEQSMVAFVRGARLDGAVGEGPDGHRLEDSVRASEPVAEVEQTFDEDQTFRYAEASGDPMRVHLDDEYARSVGLPGIIIHGLCTMAFTSSAVIRHACPEDPSRLKRLAVRFASTARPGQTITTRIWSGGTRDGRARYAYETTSDSGDCVITDGLAEIARS